MKFVTKVIGIKSIRSKKFALVSGSVHNIKPTLHNKNLPISIFPNHQHTAEKDEGLVDIVGYTCMEHDCLYHEYDHPIAVGDFVVFDNVGAYTIVMKPPFIRPSPPIIGYDLTSGEIEIIRRRENRSDMFSTYTL
jgi:diaminopimelate decarboxylase